MKRSNLLLLYTVSFIVGTGIFIDLFHTGLFGSIDVYFYRGLALLGATSVLVGAVLFAVRRLTPGVITLKDIYIIILTLVSVNLLFFTHVPVTAERSISIFLLAHMNKNADKIFTKEEITEVFSQQYIVANDNIQKRIHEQLVSGDITPRGNGYMISPRGRQIMHMYAIIADVFSINKTNISQ